jgi:hypothetical protein
LGITSSLCAGKILSMILNGSFWTKECILWLHLRVGEIDTSGQFHQSSIHSFYVCKLPAQLFCAYVLGLYFTGVSLPAQRLSIEHLWNWLQEEKKKCIELCSVSKCRPSHSIWRIAISWSQSYKNWHRRPTFGPVISQLRSKSTL